MRWLSFLVLLLTTYSSTFAQKAFPVKVNQKWGLMNPQGQLIQEPAYDAISEFKDYGYAVMQQNGRVGIINDFGKVIVPAKYEDTKVLDARLIAVMDQSEWMVIDIDGNTVLEKGYESVHIWEGRFLGFMKDRKWGLADINGRKICSPKYDELSLLKDNYFQTRLGNNYGLINLQGDVILEPLCDAVSIHSDSLFFFKVGRSWGAVNRSGREVIPANFSHYKIVSSAFISLYRKKAPVLYSVAAEQIVTESGYEAFYPFSERFALAKKDRTLALVDWQGVVVLPLGYEEISAFNEEGFRVKKNNKWGIVDYENTLLLNFDFDYIAPPKERVFIVRKKGLLGLFNEDFDEVIPIEFNRLEPGDLQAKAYKGEGMSIYTYDENGVPEDVQEFDDAFTINFSGVKKQARRSLRQFTGNRNDFVLQNFEWFFSSRDDRWGLRRLDDGSEQIAPSFDWISIERELGLTIVGLEKFSYFDFERTSYRFEMVYGVVNNEVGLLVTEISLWDIRLSDFYEKNSKVARCVFQDGRHGLISRNPVGKIVQKGYAFIGEFNDGVARMSKKGRISGTTKRKELPKGLGNLNTFLDSIMAPSSMMDYTLYDQEFRREAQLLCENCSWGYVDTTGSVVVTPQYDHAEEFTSEVGMVELENKWGLVNKEGKTLIPCEFDGIGYLEKTENKIIRIHNNKPKYGLIDTLGQVRVNLDYDKLSDFKEGRIAVEKNNRWGFVNKEGREIVPCQFRKVKDFSEGLAAVKATRKWGFIDQNGDTAIEFNFRRLGNFKNGLAWAYTYKGVGYINQKGEFVIDPKFNKAHDFEGDIARVQVKGKYALIDKTGAYVLKPKYSNIEAFNEEGLAIVRYGNNNIKYGVINQSGKLITDNHYKSVAPYKEGRAAVKYKGNYGFIDTSGKLIIDNEYSKVSDFCEGRAAVQKDGQCGYIDLSGKLIISMDYSKCLDFDEGKAVVYQGYQQGGIVDTLGNYIIEPSINRLLDFSDGRGLVRDNQARFYYITAGADMSEGYYHHAGKFEHGVAAVKDGDRWGVINQRGIEIVRPKYDKIGSFKDGYAKVRIKRFNGLTNLDGNLIIQPEYEYITYVGEGLFRVEQGDKVGYFDQSGGWVWGLRE
ncbi:MAG: WG repeat-containing protein [Saprospiraceae bacterium]